MFLERRLRAEALDEISQVLGDRRRIEPYYLTDLAKTLYPYEKGKVVRVDRFYSLRTPPVIVDKEPAPVQGRMHCEQKRAWCHAHGIVYVPIFLRERLSAAQFQTRVTDETAAMQHGARDNRDTEVARPVVSDDAKAKFIEAEVMLRVAAEELLKGRRYTGAIRDQRLRALQQTVERELVVKAHDGQLGYEFRSRELAVATR